MGRAPIPNISFQTAISLEFLIPKLRYFLSRNKYLRSLSSIKERKSSLEERKKHHQPILDPTFTEVLELLSELPCLTPASTV